jgi:O-antigen ligase
MFFAFSIPFTDFKKLADFYFKIIFAVFTIFSLFGIAEYFLGKWSMMVWSDVGIGKIFFALNYAHNATGSVYALVSIFMLVFFLKEKQKKYKVLFLILLLIFLIALFLTKSRASYLGFAGSAVFIIWLHFKSIKKFLITIGIFIAGAIPIVLLTGVYERVLQVFNVGGGTAVVRGFIWQKAWYLFSQSPIFGIGYGRFNDVFNIDRGLFDINRLKGLSGIVMFYLKQNFVFSDAHTHNSYLQFLTETGVIGFGLLLLFWILCIAKTLKAYNSLEDNFTSKVLLCSIGGIIVLFILAFFENYLSATTIMIPVSMLSSISIGLYWERYKPPFL